MARGSRGFARGTNFRGNFRGRSGGFRGRGWRGRGGRGGGRDAPAGPALAREDDGAKAEEKFEQARVEDEIDEKLGFARFQEGPKRVGWLVNMHPVRALYLDHAPIDPYSYTTLFLFYLLDLD
jgi:DNA polymerase epsilon subunit 1